MIVKPLRVSVAVAPVTIEEHTAGAVAGDRQDAGARSLRLRCRWMVFVRSRVPNVAESVIVWGEPALKTVGSKMIVFGPERPLDRVVLAQASAVLRVPASHRVGGRSDLVGRAELVGTDVDVAGQSAGLRTAPALILGGDRHAGNCRGSRC